MNRFVESIKEFNFFNISITANGKNALIGYCIGASACIIVYGYRNGVKALREFLIKEKQEPKRIEAGTSLDAVLYGTLHGIGKGIIPSLFWPALLSSYGIVKWNETKIRQELDEEYNKKQP